MGTEKTFISIHQVHRKLKLYRAYRFLSDKEMQELFMGRDFYFNTEETTARLEQRSKYFEKLHKQDTSKPARKASKRSKAKIDTEVATED
jgi:hypothetical protein